MNSKLWTYQAVTWKGAIYLLTRLSFGLSIAPKVMTAIATKVLQENEQVTRGTSAYIDDIFVDADVVSAQEIMAHLKLQ